MTRSTGGVDHPASGRAASRSNAGLSARGAKARWLKGVPFDKQATLIPPGVFDAWWNATIATDPVGSKMDPPQLRAADGVMSEFDHY